MLDIERIEPFAPPLFAEETVVGHCRVTRHIYPSLVGSGCGENEVVTRLIDCPTPTPTPTPYQYEYCDGVDNNNNGQIDEGFDLDGDGWTTCNGDCNDEDPDIYPGAPVSSATGGRVDANCNLKDDILDCIGSPVIIDVTGNGFNLTNNSNGVLFDLDSDRVKERLSWTAANSDDAWLALDRNENGMIDNGRELFGNFTPQPEPPTGEERNGFLALAKYDKPQQGGNSDGEISQQDRIFSGLRLWQDINHNGISEPSELKTLGELGLAKIELDYKQSKRTDANGNQFKYRAKVKDTNGAQLGRWAWDVFLVSQQP